MYASSDNHLLAVVDGDALITGARVLIGGSGEPTVGRLIAWPKHLLERVESVRIVMEPTVPTGTVVLPAELAERLQLAAAPVPTRWVLERDPAPLPLESIDLEAVADIPFAEQVEAISHSQELAGLLIIGKASANDESTLTIGGQSYRILRVSPAAEDRAIIQEVTPRTRVRLMASGAREAVDIVILADTSGSMSVHDLTLEEAPVAPPVPVERSPQRGLWGRVSSVFSQAGPAAPPPERRTRITRIDALQRAIGSMVDMRAQAAGRGSRFALLKFSSNCEQVFPPGDGMAEIDDHTSPEVITSFRRAVGMLRADGTTDIGVAIYRAFDVLHRNFRPDRNRLIVLVSDGAHAPGYTRDDVGREIGATEDPVPLLRRLAQHLPVKMFSIGIGDPARFREWVSESVGHARYDTPDYRPDHALLAELMRVCGAANPNPGSAEDLLRVFTDLGNGVEESIPVGERKPLPRLSDRERDAIARIGRISLDQRGGLQEAARAFRDSYERLRRICSVTVKTEPFDPNAALQWVLKDTGPATDEEAFQAFIAPLYKFVHDGRAKGIALAADGRGRRLLLSAPWDRYEEAAAHLVDPRIARTVGVARNFLHHHQGPDSSTRDAFEGLLERAIGRRHIERDDGAAWMALQEHVLQEVAAVFRDAHKALVTASERPAPTAAPVTTLRLPIALSW